MPKKSSPNEDGPLTTLGNAMLDNGIDAAVWYQYWFRDEWHIEPIITVPQNDEYWYDANVLLQQPTSKKVFSESSVAEKKPLKPED